MRTLLLLGLIFTAAGAQSKDVDLKHLRCLVCRATMDELEMEVLKANPNRLVDVGNYRMDAEGNTIRRKVPLGRSETHISILLDNICEKLTDYVRATRKSDNKLVIFNLMSPSGGMNPMMSEVDIIQDGDLNKSVKHYCTFIVDEFEEDIVSLYVDGIKNKKKELCTNMSNLCNKNYVDEDDDDDNDIDSHVDASFDEDRDEL
ncbi:PREDICTED: protein canopy homolog 2-like isoform X1 [Wasmannia auropunctata]|uniref:protein canopy homolog 2-like isoform X1 n=1 Tax=Wasmannia auropunctata TaxID=64793 RepID=UPI0005EEF901|nr:PREDICTED: protein canopy homolog 2-like isoform X1 [Wasmannia auropunctata]